MNSRERIKAIIAGEKADRCGFWLGNPDKATWPILHNFFGTSDEEQLRLKLDDDVRWICPQFFDSTYQHPDGKPMFDLGLSKKVHGQSGPLGNAQSISQIEDYQWPNPDYLNFDECINTLKNTGDFYRLSGFWTCFYHNVMDLFGFENYMLMMKTDPHLIEAATDRVCQFYYEANKRFFTAAENLIDGFFFGNDFGTQIDLICGPNDFDRFIMPWFRRFTDQAHQAGYQVTLHSCGAISRVIDRLINAGVDCIHPIQAKAANMDAQTLAANFKGRIAFMGGIDTQELLVNATPAQITEEVKRVKNILGPNLIISPSHEAVLPNVPAANVKAMADISLR